MEKERISFELKRDDLMKSVYLYVRDDKIDRALHELKRVDKSNLDIIQDTIKILEEGFDMSSKEFEAKAFTDLAAPLTPDKKIPTAGFCQIIQESSVPNTIKEGKIVLPEIQMAEIKFEDLMNNNSFMGGMR